MVLHLFRTKLYMPRWRNWTARQTSNLKVVGLSPTRGIIFFVLNDYGLLEKNKYFSTPSGTRTHNLTLRRGAPCPLGHGGLVFSWRYISTQLSPTNWAQKLGRDKDPLWAVWLTASPPSLYQFWIYVVYVTLSHLYTDVNLTHNIGLY